MWMRRDDIPEQDVLHEAELLENAVHDRRARLRRAGAGQLALRGERHAAHARSAIACRLPDEQDRCRPACLEVLAEPLPAQLRLGVLIERLADTRRGEGSDDLLD